MKLHSSIRVLWRELPHAVGFVVLYRATVPLSYIYPEPSPHHNRGRTMCFCSQRAERQCPPPPHTHTHPLFAARVELDRTLLWGRRRAPSRIPSTPEGTPPLHQVYVKLDDDIIFVKDGSFEHLVYQTLTNRDYTFFSGSVVNNPHGYGVHYFAGAYPPSTYHWRHLGPPDFPDNVSDRVTGIYYGATLHDTAGSQAHEAFVYNAARGRLDVYGFDIWNMHQVWLHWCDLPRYHWWKFHALVWRFGGIRVWRVSFGCNTVAALAHLLDRCVSGGT